MAVKRSGTRSSRKQAISVSRQPEQAADHEPSSLTQERIVATAVELLDAQGVVGLTMRGLADRLGSGVMSLYWHVNNKEDVFDLALDSVLEYRGQPKPLEAQDWREEIVHVLEDWRACMLRHPWSALLLPRRMLGPNTLSRLELLSKTLSKAGVADADLNVAIWSLWNNVMGATLTRASFDLSSNGRTAAQQHLPHLSERYPTIGRTKLLLDDDWDGAFRKGLDLLLDGLTSR
jgi:AcrR family transcriptional regulator